MRAIGFICLIGLAVALSAPVKAAQKTKGMDRGAAITQCKQEVGQGHRSNQQEVKACVQRKMHGG